MISRADVIWGGDVPLNAKNQYLHRDIVRGTAVELNGIADATIGREIVRLDGEFNGRRASFPIDDHILSRHMLIVGSSGYGKTNLFYHIVSQIRQKMTGDDVMIIFDTKGDFFDRFFDASRGDGVIGNSKMYRPISERWAMHDELMADGSDVASVSQNALEMGKSLFAEAIENNGGGNPFFPRAASDLFASTIDSLSSDGCTFSNDDLRNLLDTSSIQDYINLLSQYSRHAAVTSYIGGSKTSAQSQGVISEMNAILRSILIGVFAEEGNFSMRQFVRRKGARTLFVEYDLAIGETLGPIYSLLVDLALKEALGRQNDKGRVYLIVDELKLLPNLRHLDDATNFGRSKGMRVIAGLQSIKQLNAVYANKDTAENIINGFGSVFTFHANDHATRRHIIDRFGTNMSWDRYQIENGEVKYDRRDGHVIEDWDIMGLDIGEAIVALLAKPPFAFKFDLFGN